jgi:hypothetical protein
MTQEILKPGAPFLFMKVGVHANESLQDILDRKRKEIEQAGVSFWGYGGSSCHPFNAVQPFVKEVSDKGTTVRLLMQEITSRHFAEGLAKEYSADGGKTYHPVPKGVKVLGSRYALVIKTLDEIDINIPLSQTLVGIGNKVGLSGANYIRGHVDKACLIYNPLAAPADGESPIHLRLAAELGEPYAVVLR